MTIQMTLQEIEEKLKILHEDNHIIVVVKPRNIPSQADNTGDLDLLSLIKNYLKLKYDKKGNVYTGLVHRLDRPTGGVMVFAKTDKAASRLSEQLREHEMQKRYLAVVAGTPKIRVGKLIHYLIKDERQNIVKCHSANIANSKKAELEYKVLDNTDDGLSLVDINLITGRSHQARVQMAAIGHQLYGDHKYNPTGKTVGYGKQLALWSYSLSFTHPTKGNTHVFKVFPPTLDEPWNYFSIEKHIPIVRPT